MRRKIPRLLGIAVLAAGGTLALPTASASAHTSCASLSGGRGMGCISADHRTATACDTAADNWGVRIYVEDIEGGARMIGDGNGSANGCGSGTAPAGLTYYSFNVCAGPSGLNSVCTGWRTA